LPDRLTALQERILEILAPVRPAWALTGGGALAGFHLRHRRTQDLDLFFHGTPELGPLLEEVRSLLRREGLELRSLRTGSTFHRLRVSDGDEAMIVDLVAEPVATLETPQEVGLGSARILVDTPHEILVNKLCALLSRSETRDLVDLRALLAAGGDLDRALADAPRKDGGFSALSLAGTVRQLPVAAEELDPALLEGLGEFRDALVDRLVRRATPGGE